MTNGNSAAALSRRGLLIGFAIGLAGTSAALAAQPSGAKVFLNSIYKNYVGSSAGTAKGLPLTNAKLVRGYFTVGLASLINEDRATATKRGEPPVLDGDPFIGSQEWDISDLAIDVKEASPVKATGTVTFMNSGKPGKVVVELLRSGNDWRVSDITWESGSLRGLYRRKASRDTDVTPR